MYRVLILAGLVIVACAAGCGKPGTTVPGVSPRDGRAAFDDGFAAFKAGQWQRAVDGFTRYLRSDPPAATRGEVFYYRGEAYARMGRRADAMTDFRGAIGADPPQPILAFTHVAIGNLYFEEGSDTRAAEEYGEAIKGPQDALPMERVLLRLGISLQRIGNFAKGNQYLALVAKQYAGTPAGAEAQRRCQADSFSVQTGAYSTATTAQREIDRLRAAGFTARMADIDRSGQTLRSVQVGRAKTYAEAQTLAQRLSAKGFATVIVP